MSSSGGNPRNLAIALVVSIASIVTIYYVFLKEDVKAIKPPKKKDSTSNEQVDIDSKRNSKKTSKPKTASPATKSIYLVTEQGHVYVR